MIIILGITSSCAKVPLFKKYLLWKYIYIYIYISIYISKTEYLLEAGTSTQQHLFQSKHFFSKGNFSHEDIIPSIIIVWSLV